MFILTSFPSHTHDHIANDDCDDANCDFIIMFSLPGMKELIVLNDVLSRPTTKIVSSTKTRRNGTCVVIPWCLGWFICLSVFL
jgi:hypothetical protein